MANDKDTEKDRLTLRNEVLFITAEKFCVEQGLSKDFIHALWNSGSDWEFILKIDALLETAAKLILRNGLQIHLKKRTVEDSWVTVPSGIIQNEMLEDFVDCLGMDGRTSLLKLLEASGLGEGEINFIRATRQVRNAFAHDLANIDLRLVDIVKSRKDKSFLIKHLCSIQEYDEADLIDRYERDASFFRFGIFDAAVRFLLFAYHLGK